VDALCWPPSISVLFPCRETVLTATLSFVLLLPRYSCPLKSSPVPPPYTAPQTPGMPTVHLFLTLVVVRLAESVGLLVVSKVQMSLETRTVSCPSCCDPTALVVGPYVVNSHEMNEAH
jgi:hypothetical protein